MISTNNTSELFSSSEFGENSRIDSENSPEQGDVSFLNTEVEKTVKSTYVKNILKEANPLRIGTASLQELEEMVKAYRFMNGNCLKNRYIMSRDMLLDETGNEYLGRGEDLNVSHLKKIRKRESDHFLMKIFIPDEGIVIISDKTTVEGKQIDQRIYHHVMRLGKNAYEGFTDRIGSLHDFLNMFTGGLFPKLILIGVIQTDLLEMERINLKRIKRLDPFLRFLEVTHFQLKPFPLIPGIKSIHIAEETEAEWNSFLESLVVEYTKPYFVED